MEDIKTGTLFTYKGPRRFPFFRKEVALGCIIGIQEENGIVIIRTYTNPEIEESSPRIGIGLMPILFSSFRKSADEIFYDKRIDVTDSWPQLANWREEYTNGSAGAFKDVIWKIENMVWETLKEQHPHADSNCFLISFAYPIMNRGSFSSIRIEASER